MRRTIGLLSLIGFTPLIGCSGPRTETGYEPHRLSLNGSQIRTLYAPDFSPEAQAAKSEQNQTLRNISHPGPGGSGF